MSALDEYYRNVRNLEYMPRSKYLLNPPTLDELEEEDTVVDTPPVNPIAPIQNIGGGGGGGITSLPPNQLLGNFTSAVQDRQQSLENPSLFAQKLYDLGFPQQRSVDQMMRDATAYNMAQLGPDFKQIGITSNMSKPEIDAAMAAYAADETSIGNYPAEDPRDVRFQYGIPTLSSILSKVVPSSYYDKMTVPEQIYTQSKMGYRGPTIFGENTTGGNKDIFGRNVVSGFGNYVEKQKKDIAKLDNYFGSELFDKRYGKDTVLEFDEETGQFMFKGPKAAAANRMNKLNLIRYNYDKKGIDEFEQIKDETGFTDIERADKKRTEQLQKQLDEGTYGKGDPPDRDRKDVTTESAAKTSKVGGGGYTKSDAKREDRRSSQYGFKKGGLAEILGF